MVFETEKKVYDQHLKEWLQKGLEGRFVVIRGTRVLGHFATFQEAYTRGAAEFTDQFFVRSVSASDDVQIIQRVHW